MDQPYELLAHGKQIHLIEVPGGWVLDEWAHVDPQSGTLSDPERMLKVWKTGLRCGL